MGPFYNRHHIVLRIINPSLIPDVVDETRDNPDLDRHALDVIR